MPLARERDFGGGEGGVPDADFGDKQTPAFPEFVTLTRQLEGPAESQLNQHAIVSGVDVTTADPTCRY
jgi:hypothetical protein